MTHRNFMVGVLLALASMWSNPTMLAHATSLEQEYTVKAAFLYKFTKFVDWPAGAFPAMDSPFTICTIGNDPFGSNLDAVAGKSVKDRTVAVKRIQSGTVVDGCQILYVSPTVFPQTRDLLAAVEKAPVLTVCDQEECAKHGFMIGLRMENNRVRLSMNLTAIQQTGLKVSSQLINLATQVETTR